jgi:hypothetical protein
VSRLHSLQSYTPIFHAICHSLHNTLQIKPSVHPLHLLHIRAFRNCLLPRTYSSNSFIKTEFLDVPVPLRNPQSYKSYCCLKGVFTDPYRNNEPGEGCVTSLAEPRKSHDIPLLLVPCNVIVACCVETVWCGSARHGTARRRHRFPYCCVACIRSRVVYWLATT